jgi:hypothetical protein
MGSAHDPEPVALKKGLRLLWTGKADAKRDRRMSPAAKIRLNPRQLLLAAPRR